MCYMFPENEFCDQVSFLQIDVFGRITVSFSTLKALGRSSVKRPLKNFILYFSNLFEPGIDFSKTTLN